MSKLCMINRIRHLLDYSALSIVINSLVFSKLFYCSSIWSGTSKSNISKLQLVQNFAARILSGKKKYEHITPTLKLLRLLPISDALYLRDATLMYKCMNSLAPHYLVSMFAKRSEIAKIFKFPNAEQRQLISAFHTEGLNYGTQFHLSSKTKNT